MSRRREVELRGRARMSNWQKWTADGGRGHAGGELLQRGWIPVVWQRTDSRFGILYLWEMMTGAN